MIFKCMPGGGRVQRQMRAHLTVQTTWRIGGFFFKQIK